MVQMRVFELVGNLDELDVGWVGNLGSELVADWVGMKVGTKDGTKAVCWVA